MTRSAQQRRADLIERLETADNIWVATASGDGNVHSVPFSLAWDGNRIMVATPDSTVTARNCAETGRARAHLDSSYDVAVIDGDVETVPFLNLTPTEKRSFVERVGWDPSNEPQNWVALYVTPTRVQVWSGVEEIAARDIMIDGRWVSD